MYQRNVAPPFGPPHSQMMPNQTFQQPQHSFTNIPPQNQMMNYTQVPFQPYQQQINQPLAEERPPVKQGPYVQFAKPPQPNQWNPYYSLEQQFPQYGQMNGQKGLMQYFQDKNGQLDLDKMLSTMGQVANTANQFSPLVKSLSSVLTGFKV